MAVAASTAGPALAGQDDLFQFGSSATASSAVPLWSITRKDGVNFEIMQRPLALTEAFFQGRGFTPDLTQRIARACVLAVRIRNNLPLTTVGINLGDWRVILDRRQQPLRLEADWQMEWQQKAVPLAARTAFRYSMLPTVMSLAPGDWMQGFITANLNQGQKFDLIVHWTEDGNPKQAQLSDIRCAAGSSS